RPRALGARIMPLPFRGAPLYSSGVIRAALCAAFLACAAAGASAACTDRGQPGVDWRRCALDGGELRGADLRQAKLRDASFDRADLGGADLSLADAYRAKLVSADLKGAKLEGAVF